jgi:hypothetical protein
VPVLALTLLVLATVDVGTASADPRVSASIGVGCRVSGGVATVTLKQSGKASPSGNVVTDYKLFFEQGDNTPDVQVDGGNPNTPTFTDTYSQAVTSGTYYARLEVTDSFSNTATRTARADITINGSSVRCSVRTPA